MAKRICGATDRIDQAGLLGSCRGVRRAAPSPPTRIVPEILQRGSHALIAEQGCTGFACGPDRWLHHCQAAPRRIASSVRPDLISGRDRRGSSLASPEADAKKGKISMTSPLARALVSKKKGVQVEVVTPGGARAYEIVKVEWK